MHVKILFLIFSVITIVSAATTSKCKEREEFRECGTMCEKTCSSLKEAPKSCPLRCKRGCFCKPGFVRDKRGRCVNEKACSENGPYKSSEIQEKSLKIKKVDSQKSQNPLNNKKQSDFERSLQKKIKDQQQKNRLRYKNKYV